MSNTNISKVIQTATLLCINIKQLYCDNSTENGKIFYKISLCVQKNVKVKNNKVLRDISSPNTKEFVIHEIIVNI